MNIFMEYTVSQERTSRNAILYGFGCFLSIFFLICAALSASGILGSSAGGGLQINWLWLICMIVCLLLAALAFFGKDYLRLDYDYSLTDSVIDVSRVLNNKRRKHLIEFDLGKVTSCGSVSSQGFLRAKAAPGLTKNNWFIHEDAKLYYFVHESRGQRYLTVLELSDEMAEEIRRSRVLQLGAWHDEEGKV